MLAAALALDALAGDPETLWRRVPHPVAVLGGLVGLLDRGLNRPRLSPHLRTAGGILAIVIVTVMAAAVGALLEFLCSLVPYGFIATIVVAAVMIAGRSLYDHVRAVRAAFATGGLDAARTAVARIVGRDPASLDEPAVCRAAIESAAENFADGVVAPAFWFALLGLPGLLAYKAINTADSMIGHRTPRYERFGWASARLDDLVNLPASRLAGALIALAAPVAGGSIAEAFRVMRRDAPTHHSPNAGWPEAAMAAALGLALLGPRRYRGVLTAAPYLNAAGRRRATPDDIGRALRVYAVAWGLLFLLAATSGGLVIALS
ncbi:MAG: cobalamin biosynthesis protein [Bauldia sp.]|nr:cobalamin biosynthesis protein [Bauldia sp.]